MQNIKAVGAKDLISVTHSRLLISSRSRRREWQQAPAQGWGRRWGNPDDKYRTRGKLGAAENEHLGTAREQMLAGRAERGCVVREVACLDAVIDDVHDGGLIGWIVRGQKVNAAAGKCALIDAGLHGAVGRKKAGTFDAASLECIARNGDHVQNGNGNRGGDGIIKVVRGVAGHDEKSAPMDARRFALLIISGTGSAPL